MGSSTELGFLPGAAPHATLITSLLHFMLEWFITWCPIYYLVEIWGKFIPMLLLVLQKMPLSAS